MNTQCKQMKKVIEQILAKQGKLQKFNSGEFHIRIKNEPYMDLVVERHDKQVTITHYFEQNGDLIPDPDQEFIIGADGEWYPVAIQFATGHYVRAREWRDGKEFINFRECVDQAGFSRMWARNIKAQGLAIDFSWSCAAAILGNESGGMKNGLQFFRKLSAPSIMGSKSFGGNLVMSCTT